VDPVALIGRNDRVTIETPHGSRLTGTAVLFNRESHLWVLNLGGPYGRPGIASGANIVKIKKPGAKRPCYEAA
jgi:hypothetical protein